ncbi:stage V sporulation protein AE [Caldanaerobius fijiensis DSM 17918]|uniref:Stage V sporulation protein AE n=1 Tax=Caldanaerobius fijiensis DSM 17918 TaxID=1121256 RepID=A0A1M4UBF6_9THEO|nr:stage V sporulation protein AE [Caldanaerobius fijiensis]SHE54069.1 stage V sporulation protein AE [Caldanaerobius fijiensis DSM 17918]
MDYLKAFVVGGFICVIAQILIDKTKLTSARVLVVYVVAGAVLSGLGIYQRLVDFGGAGATIPLTGFGHSLVQGTIKAIKKEGLIGVLTGGFQASAGGLGAAVVFGYIFSILFKPKTKP